MGTIRFGERKAGRDSAVCAWEISFNVLPITTVAATAGAVFTNKRLFIIYLLRGASFLVQAQAMDHLQRPTEVRLHAG
jgi:hypothetical protein